MANPAGIQVRFALRLCAKLHPLKQREPSDAGFGLAKYGGTCYHPKICPSQRNHTLTAIRSCSPSSFTRIRAMLHRLPEKSLRTTCALGNLLAKGMPGLREQRQPEIQRSGRVHLRMAQDKCFLLSRSTCNVQEAERPLEECRLKPVSQYVYSRLEKSSSRSAGALRVAFSISIPGAAVFPGLWLCTHRCRWGAQRLCLRRFVGDSMVLCRSLKPRSGSDPLSGKVRLCHPVATFPNGPLQILADVGPCLSMLDRAAEATLRLPRQDGGLAELTAKPN